MPGAVIFWWQHIWPIKSNRVINFQLDTKKSNFAYCLVAIERGDVALLRTKREWEKRRGVFVKGLAGWQLFNRRDLGVRQECVAAARERASELTLASAASVLCERVSLCVSQYSGAKGWLDQWNAAAGGATPPPPPNTHDLPPLEKAQTHIIWCLYFGQSRTLWNARGARGLEARRRETKHWSERGQSTPFKCKFCCANKWHISWRNERGGCTSALDLNWTALRAALRGFMAGGDGDLHFALS